MATTHELAVPPYPGKRKEGASIDALVTEFLDEATPAQKDLWKLYSSSAPGSVECTADELLAFVILCESTDEYGDINPGIVYLADLLIYVHDHVGDPDAYQLSRREGGNLAITLIVKEKD